MDRVRNRRPHRIRVHWDHMFQADSGSDVRRSWCVHYFRRVCLSWMLIVFVCWWWCSDVPPDAIASRSRFSDTLLHEDSRCFHTLHIPFLGRKKRNERNEGWLDIHKICFTFMNASTYTHNYDSRSHAYLHISVSVVLFISFFFCFWLAGWLYAPSISYPVILMLCIPSYISPHIPPTRTSISSSLHLLHTSSLPHLIVWYSEFLHTHLTHSRTLTPDLDPQPITPFVVVVYT